MGDSLLEVMGLDRYIVRVWPCVVVLGVLGGRESRTHGIGGRLMCVVRAHKHVGTGD